MPPIVTYVDDNETIYRRVDYRLGSKQWQKEDETGRLIITQFAFDDSGHKPSVDRAKLCDNSPAWTQQNDDRNGVVSLLVGEVRAMDDIATEVGGRIVITHHVDVIHRPEENNYAHSQIETSPAITGRGAFRKFRVSLATMANQRGWLIEPFTEQD